MKLNPEMPLDQNKTPPPGGAIKDSRALKRLNCYRRLLAILSACVLLAFLVYVLSNEVLRPGPAFIHRAKPFNEMTKAGIDIRLDQSRSFFQIATLILGGLWGLLIAKKGEAALVFRDVPEMIMVVCASSLLLLSIACHTVYVNRVTGIYSDAAEVIGKEQRLNAAPISQSIPDVFGPNINYLFVSQYLFLTSGALISLFTFLSAHHLKGGDGNEKGTGAGADNCN